MAADDVMARFTAKVDYHGPLMPNMESACCNRQRSREWMRAKRSVEKGLADGCR